MCPTAGTPSLSRETSRKPPNLRSAFEVLDADKDGKISPDDLRTFYGHYNFEGTVSPSSSSSSSSPPPQKDGVIISSMISAADENRDGFVEYEEFEKVLLGSRETTAAPNGRRMNNNNNNSTSRFGGMDFDFDYYYLMENVFRVMDKDGDGKVGHEDLKTYLTSAGFDATDDEDVKAMIRLAADGGGGGDGDGGVTFEALIKVLFP